MQANHSDMHTDMPTSSEEHASLHPPQDTHLGNADPPAHEDQQSDLPSHETMLSAKLAAEIYAERCLKAGHATVESAFVASKYGTSPKTVRDIWSRRTWADATRPLWTEEERSLMAAKEEGKDHPMQPDSKKRKRDDDHAGCSSSLSSGAAAPAMADIKSQASQGGSSAHELCWGSEASTKCDKSSGKESPEESSDASISKGSGPDGSPEGSSSPTSSFPSKSTTSSDAGRSEQHGSQGQPPGASMTDLQEALGQDGGGGGSSEDRNSEDRKSSDSEEPKDPFSDSGHAERAGAGGEAGKHNWMPEAEPQPGERKHRRESTFKKSQGGEGIDSQTAGEIAGLLRHMTEQQEQIIAQQKLILERGLTPNMDALVHRALNTVGHLRAEMEAWSRDKNMKVRGLTGMDIQDQSVRGMGKKVFVRKCIQSGRRTMESGDQCLSRNNLFHIARLESHRTFMTVDFM
ncbi:hypothetical protein GUITHDRAFT_117466 [Guillardia theta CCMP2712]|uniref:Uncharacterized protein n=1 Tax=Guillardia theta (strain CCMP2712) TaxID=905079 RepID=L1IJT7_GUITC|nr:hypothetical protein GUITHDRAFT_117466 [Guillardia theta CCMP2712]EKX36357.1 hypothetical protein GUITHDRAFT_117466 [Guillardia theta CCMP2712]|eukprot:XP_005823337.1 hypothetical protein GUITHDRAFT_117466 [Guillardia theta CCMP2712]